MIKYLNSYKLLQIVAVPIINVREVIVRILNSLNVQIAETHSGDYKFTLLHYIVKTIHSSMPELIGFTMEFEHLESAQKVILFLSVVTWHLATFQLVVTSSHVAVA